MNQSRLLFLTACAFVAAAGTARAELTRVSDRETFLNLVTGRELTRPLVNLTVTADGRIDGTGAAWDVDGTWSWEDGYFCRDINWGGDNLGYNCQLVTADGNEIRFTSDRGEGRSAGFTLR